MTLDSVISKVGTVIVNPLILLLFAIALVVFLWGMFQFIKNADSEKDREVGKKHIMWGLIGMFIMVGAYGLIRIILGTFGIDAAPITDLQS